MHRQIGGCGSSSSLATPASSLYNCRLLRPQTIMAPPPAKRGRHSRIIVSSASSSSSLHPSTEMKEVAVLGSGAAGLTAAYFAAVTQKSKKNFVNTKVTVYEKTKESGKKILMSGGARCNVLPVEASISDYVTDSNPRLAKAILQSWTIPNCLYWLQDEVQIELGIEHTTNKYFPLSNSSREVRDKLVEACKREGVVSVRNKRERITKMKE